jgi:shikimate kinase
VDPVTRRRLSGSALTVYLRVSPAEAARRLGASAQDRPLLAGGDPEPRLRELLERREAIYLESEQRVTTDGRTPRAVADQIVKLAREDASL